MTQKLLVATHNQGKLREYQALLADLPLTVTSLQLEGVTQDVEETGTTFAENAILKATAYAQLTGLMTWADDSGLEVDPLAGRPGVYSARYGGAGLTDQQRYQQVLAELAPLPKPWTARFRCVVAIVSHTGKLMTAEDRVEGEITDEPRGVHGFGYDPIFFLPDHQCTMAELAPAQKNLISHRAKAAAQARRILVKLLHHQD